MPANRPETPLHLGGPVAWAAPATAPAPAVDAVCGDPSPVESPDDDARATDLAATVETLEVHVRGLNRDLGRVEQWLMDHQEQGEESVGARQRIRGWFQSLRHLWRPRAQTKDTGKKDESTVETPFWKDPLVPFAEEGGPERVIAVTAMGLADEALKSVLDTVEDYCRTHDTVPVLLTDSENFEVFRQRRMAFEHLPAAHKRDAFAPDLPWPLYFRRRMSHFQRKWRPVGMISFGEQPPVEDLEILLTSDGKDSGP